ncbi:MAG: hypothetical protein KJ914_13175 [Gammaproteobacteria bacterium]|nr:hypothetical protein [Gammaproteobacteria bacterium]MBU1725388.1 hypothetical protein [Gammaproteobacteria bacterium]MBU2005258.1 hypothetical protein [Gammaproteobacteria bacterium]
MKSRHYARSLLFILMMSGVEAAGNSIDMQIVGEVPAINARDDSRLDFAAGSSLRVTIQPQGETASTVIAWNASGCTSTQSGHSRQCRVEERRQVIALIKQLPTPPVPPAV